MEWLKEKLTKLQQKPYANRVKILKGTLVVAAVLLLILWIIFLQFRQNKTNGGTSKFKEIFQNFEELIK